MGGGNSFVPFLASLYGISQHHNSSIGGMLAVLF